ncbi:MAG: hypothetical protein RIR26_662 [Pseudomonadota bacterium]|jgi:hypothetical protein
MVVMMRTPLKWERLATAGLFLFCFANSSAQGIDFKVELPPQKGVLVPEGIDYFDDDLMVSEGQAESPFLQIGEALDAMDSTRSKVETKTQSPAESNPVAKAESAPALQNKPQPQRASVDAGRFPNLQCLQDNVTFWKRVYSEIDTDEALIHDREGLDKVYASVRLGGSEAQKRNSMKLLREHYKNILTSLASKLDAPSAWNSTERTMAKLFRPSELTRGRLLQAADNVRIQQGLKSRFDGGVKRSLQYLPVIKSIVRQQNLPLDVAYLPHVESSFVNYAKSKVGAVGLWQLMPSTMHLLMGKHAVSKRTDPHTATFAATKLLKQNYQATGSWPLALTAYNHGLAGVMRAVRKTGSTDLCQIIDRYNSPSFRFASSNFYAQFLAAREVALQRYSQLSKNSDVGKIVAPLLASRDKGAL